MPSKFTELEGFNDLYKLLENSQEAIEKGAEKGLKKAGARVAGAAKAKLGTYQPTSGMYPGWPGLKPETVRRKHLSKSNAFHINEQGQIRINVTNAGKRYLKEHEGWGHGGNDDAPLVDTGHLKQSVTTDTQDVHKGIVYVGIAAGSKSKKGSAPSDYAAAHEFGYAPSGIPPRPYLRPAVYENREEIRDDVAEAIKEGLGSLWK